MGDVPSSVRDTWKVHLENAVNLETQLGAAGIRAKQLKNPTPPPQLSTSMIKCHRH
jgi:hypothetical protein